MHKFFISQYINKLSITDVYNFALKNNIELNNQELDIIYQTLKEKWEIILYQDPSSIFNDLKLKLNPESYQKGLILYQEYYKLYKNYL